MSQNYQRLIQVCTLAGCLTPLSLKAQVVPDNNLPDNSIVTSEGQTLQIDGGTTRENNLFHSFQNFSVPTGNTAFFNNAESIANIFSRVTGGNISNIDGLISANGAANLFLINPAGIIFGENAQLNIGGSFLGSSADSILFNEGEFSATDLNNPPLLTVNAPIGLGFRDNPGEIINRSVGQNPNGETNATGGAVGLQVPDGETLAIIGGNVLLDDGNLTAKGGHLELASVSGAGEVGINNSDLGFTLDYDAIDSFGDVTIQNTAIVDVSATGGGSINFNAENFTVDSSRIIAGIFPGLGFAEAQAGDISLNVRNSVNLKNNSRINNIVGDSNTPGVGNGGDIFIKSKNLIATDGSAVSVSTFGLGNSGNLFIEASELVEVSGESNFPGGLFAQVDTAGMGNAGDLTIKTKTLKVFDGSRITASTFGNGNAGNLNISASDIEVFETPNQNFFRTGIFASSFNAQQAGSQDFVAISEGNAGNLTIETERLTLQDGGQVSVATNGMGNAGILTVRANEFIRVVGIEDPNIFEGSLQNISTISAANEGGSGNGGSLLLETRNLEVADGGTVTVATEGIGNAGDLNITVAESTTVRGNGSGIFAQVTPEAQGRGGNINLQTGDLSLLDNAQISAATPFDSGGNIRLDVNNNLIIQDNSLISAQAFNNADGGNININADFITAFPNQTPGNGSDIIASAGAEGTGGVINLTADGVFGLEVQTPRDNSNDIDASGGTNGVITIDTPDTDVTKGIIEFPQNIVDSEETVAQVCRNGDFDNASFVVRGKGGIPDSPDAPLQSEALLNDSSFVASHTATSQAIQVEGKAILLAQGLVKDKNGKVSLTAYSASQNNPRYPAGINCLAANLG